MRARPQHSRRVAVVLILVAMMLVGAGAISHVWTRLRAIELGYAISKASKKQRRLVEINRKLKVEMALLKNPARIARIAREKLGMQQAKPEQLRRIRLEPSRAPLARAR